MRLSFSGQRRLATLDVRQGERLYERLGEIEDPFALVPEEWFERDAMRFFTEEEKARIKELGGFEELMETTEWDRYGVASGNPKCANCMVHCGYEPTAVDHTFSSFGGIWGNIKAMLFNRYANPGAAKRLQEEEGKPHGPMAHLVQLGYSPDLKEKAGAA